MRSSFWISPSISLLTGMCVHRLTTSAMSSSSTSSFSMRGAEVRRASRSLDLLLELRQPAVLQLRRLRVVAGPLGALDVQPQGLELFLQLRASAGSRPSPVPTAP